MPKPYMVPPTSAYFHRNEAKKLNGLTWSPYSLTGSPPNSFSTCIFTATPQVITD